jgi:hypothetical protein
MPKLICLSELVLTTFDLLLDTLVHQCQPAAAVQPGR